MKILKWTLGIIGGFALFLVVTFYAGTPKYEYKPTPLHADFDSYYHERIEISRNKKARPDNEERLVRYSPGKTEYSILYIHGFGASRAEGEEVTDKLAKDLKANLYYVRLPGHGTNLEDHRDTTFAEILQDSETALLESEKLGKKTILIGTSMGGLISTYLAAKYPDKVHALILASPFYDFTSPLGGIYQFSWGKEFAHLVMGKIRKSTEEQKKEPAAAFWYRDQYLAAVQNLSDLREYVLGTDPFSKITSPVLMFYYYKNEKEQDASASVQSMLNAFKKVNENGKASPFNKAVRIELGNHVLFSKYMKSDKDLILKEEEEFIQRVFAPKK
ncbi:alpha/beta hydrolase [Leptospira kmetyi]|uniref:Alpha/beta fold hydrolase n=1 Tax=Leptospira kmetyi TaxID=408139 RepID=A0A5F1XVB4_9LEPT|nr:alpha/beta hydrolase [Leptospira kmetyi]AYV55082.1 alpha/beta fold hydrolase [Leptospira kmetyi]EQA52284.1 alpha/beta hydrolase family protein [Leptospira kmetyi serovar Malaysia str. Bejo-Iso9]TGK19507.1 alpha/beta fold hydrolase [Leptospira kmetyi]TGK26448.1 alpha/beta fold hydrolase [Leptospira kmetyi]TGL70283.1 alpha/beta fold hydrolase [Leptospira kmetyi]